MRRRLKASLRQLSVLAICLIASSGAAIAGTVDPLFAPEPDGHVGAIALQADGRILIGGGFTSVGSTSVRHLARLLPDGSLDASFMPSVDGAVHVIKVQPDGRVLIGGSFTHVDGQAWGAMARLDTTGRLDTTFAPAITDGSVGSLATRPDGSVVVAGNFKTVGGASRPLLVRLASNGAIDATFVPDLGAIESVFALAVTVDGALIVSGSSTIRGFLNVPVLLKLTETGSRASAFTVALTAGDPAPIVLLPGADDTVLAGGYGFFSSLLTIGSDGTIRSASRYGSTTQGTGGLSAIARHADGRLSVGGVFDNLFYGPTPHRNVARTSLQRGVDFNYRVNADGAVVALAVQADGALLVGGYFSQVNGTPRAHLARVLDSPAASTALLVTDGARVRWELPPTAPHLTHVELQWSADGQHFSRLRALDRSPSGWEGLVGPVPPGARWVRAAGPDASGTSMIGSATIEWSHHVPTVGAGPGPFLSTSVGELQLPVSAAAATFAWTVSSDASWLTLHAPTPTTSGAATLLATPNTGMATRTATVSIAGRWFRVTQEPGNTAFAVQPGGFRQYFAEGVVSDLIDLQAYRITPFFSTEFAILNPTDSAVTAVMHFQKHDGTSATHAVDVPGRTRTTVHARHVLDLLRCLIIAVGLTACDGEFSTMIESAVPLVVDRTVSWDATRYGAHAETGVDAPARTWYLAEGATHSGFNLFYLLQNPQDTPTTVEVEYLRPAPLPPLVRSYTVGPRSRFNIWVNQDHPALAATDVSARLTASLPIIVERAMYRGATRTFAAGHGTAGVTAPEVRWFFAEGATGAYFDLFLLLANPGDVAAEVKATYLLPSGDTVVKTYTVAPGSRFNIWVDHEDARLVDTAVSTVLESTNGVPVVAERSMWWPGNAPGGWHESHASAGATETGTLWALAAGRVGTAPTHETYVLVANTSATIAEVGVTLVFEDGTSVTRTYYLAPSSRFNVAVAAEFPEAAGRHFGTLVESRGTAPAQLVVERAMYNDAGAEGWAAGTNALGRRLR